MRSRDWPHVQTNFAKQMTFTTPEHLRQHLQNQITKGLIHQVQDKCDTLTRQLEYHKQEGIKFRGYYGTGFIIEAEVWHKEKQELFGSHVEPLAFYPNFERIIRCAKEQTDATCKLLEERVGQHYTENEVLRTDNLRVNPSNNLIEGYVYGCKQGRMTDEEREATNFNIYVRMIWNYRYGQNSANGHLTQYTQFRSERHGAEMEGKAETIRKEQEAKAARQAKLQAEKDAIKEEKWGRFQKLAVQMEKWADKKIKVLGQKIAEYDDTIHNLKHNNFDTANEEHYKKVTAKDVELLNTLRNDTRTWQNDMAKLRAIFDEGCDTRPKLVERYRVWGV